MDPEILNQHLDLTSLVIKLASVLDLLDEASDNTVGHVGWHGLTAGGAVCHSFLARSAHDVSRGAAGERKVSRNLEAHRTLQLGLELG